MHYYRRIKVFVLFLTLAACSSGIIEKKSQVKILPPEELYGKLFYDVQSKAVFSDSKTFVDAEPLEETEEIRKEYQALNSPSKSEIKDFVQKNFKLPQDEVSGYKTDSSSIKQHIRELWKVLERPADKRKTGTLIPLPYPYIVPGGRFREIYYWDSYFTMLGLEADGETEVIQNMVDNFAWLIREYGFIPNGNRTYYLGRSQPPFFSLMVELLAGIKGDRVYTQYKEELLTEYQFWMAGAERIERDQKTYRRLVKMSGGEILNRYWDDKAAPRPESYREDVKTAKTAVELSPELTREEVYRNLRAAAESGWDFSSRWLSREDDGSFKLSSIHTTWIVPVDLNSLLYHLEMTLAKTYGLEQDEEKATEFRQKASSRKKAILKYCWDGKEGYFMDFDISENKRTGIHSLAGVYPLFFGLASGSQAERVAEKIRKLFLKPGGLVTTPNHTGQQWDAPNGWAPLQYLSIEALRNYEQDSLAETIRQRWLSLNKKVYQQTYKMTEKYNVEDLSNESGGGEYPTQDGFGWTNGVYQKLSSEK